MSTGNASLQTHPSTLCTLATCDLSLAHLAYLPSLGGNVLYAGLFGTFLIGQLFLGIKHRTWGFMMATVAGLVLEIIGYVARIMMHGNPFDKTSFLLYLICLTIAPALLSAAIYLCLARIVVVYGQDASRFRPATYTLLFCGCDLLALLLQAAGGAIASIATSQSSSSQVGVNIMLAGLAVQVASLLLFASLCAEFALRLYQNPPSRTPSRSPRFPSLHPTGLFRAFLVRCAFRVAELSGGFSGPPANDQVSFMLLEGCMIVVACACLTALHPGIAFQGAWPEADFTFRGRSRFRAQKRPDDGPESETPPDYELVDIGGTRICRGPSWRESCYAETYSRSGWSRPSCYSACA